MSTRGPVPNQFPAREWVLDGLLVQLDDTMLMGKGYDWTPWHHREELHTPHGIYAVWRHGNQWAAYGGPDGAFQAFQTNQAAKEAVERWDDEYARTRS